MADHSTIEWTDASWNVVTGCDRVSPGCDRCYIERTPPFRIERRRFDEQGRMGIRLHPDRLDWPLRWRKPRRIFTPSLGDLFHKDVPIEFIGSVWATMAKASQHTYQLLTKRPQRMASVLAEWAANGGSAYGGPTWRDHELRWNESKTWPLPNVWLGTSIESDRYTFRADHLRATPAAVRFLSLEPLLGPLPSLDLTGIDWVIVGGESGPGARPMHPDWARDILDRCVAAGVPFFFKQFGEWEPVEPVYVDEHDDVLLDDYDDVEVISFNRDGQIEMRFPRASGAQGHQPNPAGHPWWMARVGKKAAGRELDGRTWDQMPEAVTHG